MNLGFSLTRVIDNRKSWADSELGLRNERSDLFSSYYQVSDERLVLNSKNIEAFLNIGQGAIYDIWDMSVKYNYPIPSSGLTGDFQNTQGIDRTVISPKPKEKTFFEFAQTFYRNMINVRTRQTSSYNYPSLQKLYWDYINSEETVNIPSNKYNYQKMIDFTNGIGDYWMKIVEQVIPATTLWTGGQKFENNVLDRQKVVWRKQRGCEIIPIVQNPCTLTGPLFLYDCLTREAELDITLDNQIDILNTVLQNVINNNGYDINLCSLNSIVTNWYVNMSFGDIVTADELFFTGLGNTQVPSSEEWYDSVVGNLDSVLSYGLVYTVQENIVKIQNSGCETIIFQPTFNINLRVELSINCIDNSTGILRFIDGEPLFESREKAIDYAYDNGIEGVRTFGYNGQTGYFAGKTKESSKKLKIIKNPFYVKVSNATDDTNSSNENLIAKLNQLFYLDGSPYPQGARYHIHTSKGPMAGAYHSNSPHKYLTFTRPKIQQETNPSQSNVQESGYSSGGSNSGNSGSQTRSSGTGSSQTGSSGSSGSSRTGGYGY